MRNLIAILLSITMIIITYLNLDSIVEFTTLLASPPKAIMPLKTSEYEKDYSLSFVNKTENYTPYSYQDILNIFYTTINKGFENFTFYCPDEYTTCKADVEEISGNVYLLTHINNFVHPFNSFKSVNVQISDSGETAVTIEYLYTSEEITKIDTRVKEITNELIKPTDTDKEKIKIIHDYIIEHNKYDVLINKNKVSPYSSSNAYGALFEGYAICNGYADLMAIFLNKMGFKNIKVATTPNEISYSNTGHIWNAVYLDNKWLHLDLTWDDPVSETGEDYLFYTYFLINSSELYDVDNSGEVKYEEHNFNKSIYYEIK